MKPALMILAALLMTAPAMAQDIQPGANYTFDHGDGSSMSYSSHSGTWAYQFPSGNTLNHDGSWTYDLDGQPGGISIRTEPQWDTNRYDDDRE